MFIFEQHFNTTERIYCYVFQYLGSFCNLSMCLKYVSYQLGFPNNADAIGNLVVIFIRKENFEMICKRIPTFYELTNNLVQRSFSASYLALHPKHLAG